MLYNDYLFWDISGMRNIIKVIISIVFFNMTFVLPFFSNNAAAASCKDIEFVFARGSGAARNGSAE